jgi:hypothetical protein
MSELLHPQATHNLPAFITAPGETDTLMVVTAFILAAAVVAFGVLFLRLHALPEQIAHKSDKVQMEIVAVLCLIALFTHMHIFWIAGLLLAFIELPDFGTPLRRIAGSVERIAGEEPPPEAATEGKPQGEETPLAAHDAARKADGATPLPPKPASVPAAKKERSHA